MSKFWFKAKNYGWGWYPSSWQGWGILCVFFVLVGANFNRIDSAFIPRTFVLTLLLILICYKKGEKPEWRWKGKKIKF